jgi:hypothetical protein
LNNHVVIIAVSIPTNSGRVPSYISYIPSTEY